MDELTPEQQEELHNDLLRLRQEIQASLVQNVDDMGPIDLDLPIGRVSRIDAIQQQKMAQANRRNQELRLQQIQAALHAYDRGEYGICRVCHDEIAHPRLKARPETPLCLDCQNRVEQRRR